MIRDILHRLAERCPTRVLVWPVPVQGEGAAEKIAAAVRGFGALEAGGAIPRPDLVIVARGGGSIEDLWAFNEEAVVRAVAASPIPVISAVGHETDTTLCDFAADLRAPTPTAAAERAVPVRAELLAQVRELGARTERCARRYRAHAGERFAAVARRLPGPDALFAAQRQRLDDAAIRLPRALRHRLGAARADLGAAAGALRPPLLRTRLAQATAQLRHARFGARLIVPATQQRARRLADLARLLGSLDPLAPLARGYVKVERRTGGVLTTAAQARGAGALSLQFRDGAVDVRVEKPGGGGYPRAAPDQPSLL